MNLLSKRPFTLASSLPFPSAPSHILLELQRLDGTFLRKKQVWESLDPQMKVCDLLSAFFRPLCTPASFLRVPGGALFLFRFSFSISLLTLLWLHLICLFDSWTSLPREIIPMCGVLPKGTGWVRRGRASCQQAVGRVGAGRLVGPGGHSRCIQGEDLPGEGESLGQLGNSRGWEKPGS